MTKNVPLRNDTAKVKDVCTLLAHMMAISNHADHALFSIVDGKGKILERAHWSKLTLIPFLIWRTFDHSRRWEMIKELQI